MRQAGLHEGPGEDAPLSSTRAATVEALAAAVAHDINNPLAAVIANVEFLAELLAQIDAESSRGHLATTEGREWLGGHLGQADVSLRDARQAAERIRAVVEHMKLRSVPTGEPSAAPIVPAFAAAAEGKLAFPAEPETGTRALQFKSLCVLVVDDEELVARALVRSLRGYDVVTALSAQLALGRLATGERFDIILCDLMMPEMTGMDLYDEVLRLAPDQARRMVFITGGATSPRTKEFLATTPNRVITKPFDPQTLRDTIIELARTREGLT